MIIFAILSNRENAENSHKLLVNIQFLLANAHSLN